MAEDVVRLTEASSELEAAEICGYLEAQGIRAVYDKGGILGAAGMWNTYSGPNIGRQEILVRAEDLDAARAALVSLQGTS